MTGFLSRVRIRMSTAFYLTLLLTSATGSHQTFAEEESARSGTTPSHENQAVQDLTAEINVLRDASGIYDYPPEAELQKERTPIQVYVKTLEVLTKVSGMQRRLGVPSAPVGRIPLKDVNAADVLTGVGLMLSNRF